MGRSAHAAVRRTLLHLYMDEGGTLHRIEDELGDRWIDEWVESGIGAIESYLEKHLAFQIYLDDAPS